jgi:hypothetical protein
MNKIHTSSETNHRVTRQSSERLTRLITTILHVETDLVSYIAEYRIYQARISLRACTRHSRSLSSDRKWLPIGACSISCSSRWNNMNLRMCVCVTGNFRLTFCGLYRATRAYIVFLFHLRGRRARKRSMGHQVSKTHDERETNENENK